MKAVQAEDGKFLFYCEGCQMLHGVDNKWTFNGNFEDPTFQPSILVSGTKMTEKGESEYEEWCSSGCPHRDEPFESISTVCHSFVTNGKIQYLNDCTHDLAGKTVELKDEGFWFST